MFWRKTLFQADIPLAAETALVPPDSRRLASSLPSARTGSEKPVLAGNGKPVLASVLPTVTFLSRLAHTTWLADPFRASDWSRLSNAGL